MSVIQSEMSQAQVLEAQKSMVRQQVYGNLIAAYSAQKLNSIGSAVEQTNVHLEVTNKNLKQLNSTATQLLGIAGRQLELSKQMSNSLSVIEAHSSEQLKVSQSSLDEQKKQTRLQELQFEFERAKEARNEARYEQTELERKRLRAVKDSIHHIHRQTTLIKDGSYTALERVFLLGRLLPAIEMIYADDFDDISDKQYRDEAEDMLRRDLSSYESLLSEEDKADLLRLRELESVDEDQIAEELLAKCKIKFAESKLVRNVRNAIRHKKELDISTTTHFLKELSEAIPTD